VPNRKHAVDNRSGRAHYRAGKVVMANSSTADGPADLPAQKTDHPVTHTTSLLFDTEDGIAISPPKRHPIVITPALAKVFVRASRTSAGTDPPLSFGTLLVAMLVDEDGWLKRHFESHEVRFDEIARHRSYNAVSLQSLGEGELEPEYLTTVSARAALEEAMRIARSTTGGTTIDLRHLCAAYPILSKWHVPDFQTFNIDRLNWARELGAEMAQRFPKERPYWSLYADRASPVPLTSFSADVYSEEDLLGIDRSVDALALLIASAGAFHVETSCRPMSRFEVICPACDGTGFQRIQQPTEPARRIYPASCKECVGKGQIRKPQSSSV
jgi:hypothetical protein